MTSLNNSRFNQVIINSIKLNISYRPKMILLILKSIFCQLHFFIGPSNVIVRLKKNSAVLLLNEHGLNSWPAPV